jgi:hypothetical protein
VLPIEIPIEISRARYEPAILTDSAQSLQEALDRGPNNETPLEATKESLFDLKKDRPESTRDPLAPQQQLPTERLDQAATHADPAPTKVAELEIEAPEIDLDDLIL